MKTRIHAAASSFTPLRPVRAVYDPVSIEATWCPSRVFTVHTYKFLSSAPVVSFLLAPRSNVYHRVNVDYRLSVLCDAVWSSTFGRMNRFHSATRSLLVVVSLADFVYDFR